jgi:hypothetical protein
MPREAQSPTPPRSYRYYDFMMAAFVTVLLCANVIDAAKVARIGGPLTCRVVNALKRAVSEDYFDRATNFTPFSLQA